MFVMVDVMLALSWAELRVLRVVGVCLSRTHIELLLPFGCHQTTERVATTRIYHIVGLAALCLQVSCLPYRTPRKWKNLGWPEYDGQMINSLWIMRQSSLAKGSGRSKLEDGTLMR
jgi:hypothetical protein